MTKTNNARQVVTKAINGDRLHEDEESGALVVVVVVVDGGLVDGLSVEAGEDDEEDGDLAGAADEPDSTLTESFIPFAQ